LTVKFLLVGIRNHALNQSTGQRSHGFLFTQGVFMTVSHCAHRVLWQLAFVLSLLTGCGTSIAPTPVSVTCRSSLVGVGQVVIITNNSGHHLYNVKVVARSFQSIASASVKAAEHLAPGSSVEVGWLQFGNWVPEPEETIEI
jgi:hypothetical protein